MQLEDFARYFSLSDDVKDFILQHGYGQISDHLSCVPDSLSDEFILQQLQKLRTPIEPAALLEAAAELRSDPYLLSCFNLLDHYWFHTASPLMYGSKLPEYNMNPNGKAHAGIYYLLNALACFPVIRQNYAALGVPEQYALDTVQYLSGAIQEYAAGNDEKLGISGRKLHWFSFYVQGKLFRIGRFEYMIQDPLNYLPAAYRRKSDGKVIALCRNGWQLDKNGYWLFTDESPDQAYCIATLQSSENSICGIPIDPRGFAEVDRRITLDLNEYTPLWNNWDLVPGLHIPGGGGMTPEACYDSLSRALEFFPRYFKRRVAAVSCFSWIFNPDFELELPESNVARFMRQVYLFPFPSVGVEGLAFVFGKSDADYTNYPADNSLRRAFHSLRQQGKRLKAGGMFITPEAVNNFGCSIYRQDHSAFESL